ncbi:unnamed protein product [Rotaria magnacalcarata]|uniref:EF-hand domain-containing protein n=3 Tax=Rotaria magnacalcarata TaxID=392030 RepID=A0A819BX40_9BILA|nr:unnamed protein product [Rotaria magnacalcarata]CAF3801710.1 unnamed protein product [Rotaria magnacalcarata]CAF3807635.1 unnamed protein product [Rotaria magnacalcarata]CAF4081529.1 unnamed protein product [Rotaria magnacalcarata]
MTHLRERLNKFIRFYEKIGVKKSFGLILFQKNMSLEVLAEQQLLQQTTPLFNAELINKYSKYVKTIGKRVVEVEFCWYQANPYQSFQLRMTEKQYIEAQKYITSKKLLNMNFEQFIDLIAPVFANNAAEISDFMLRTTFDRLFDLNENGTIERDEFDSLLILLRAFNRNGNNLQKNFVSYENLRQRFTNLNGHISFKEFSDFVKRGYVRELLMN